MRQNRWNSQRPRPMDDRTRWARLNFELEQGSDVATVDAPDSTGLERDPATGQKDHDVRDFLWCNEAAGVADCVSSHVLGGHRFRPVCTPVARLALVPRRRAPSSLKGRCLSWSIMTSRCCRRWDDDLLPGQAQVHQNPFRLTSFSAARDEDRPVSAHQLCASAWRMSSPRT
jgi:hypothetical protein